MNFFVIQENKAENVFMMLVYELFLLFQIHFHYHKYFHDLKFSLLKIAWRINEWRRC